LISSEIWTKQMTEQMIEQMTEAESKVTQSICTNGDIKPTIKTLNI